MPMVKAYDDIPNPRVERQMPTGHKRWNTHFFRAPVDDKTSDGNVAFTSEGSRHFLLRTHFHTAAQFQVVVVGEGSLGPHQLKFGGVHFTSAYTPYGPIWHGDNGLGFLTLRAHRDPGAQYMPESRAVLDSVPNRNPWQTTAQADFNLTPGESGVAMKAIDGLKDDHGLAGFSLLMKPGAKAYAPDPSRGDGQYIVVLKGGLLHEGQQKNGLAVVWVGKNEGPFQIEAGPAGCEALILNFPVPGSGKPDSVKPRADGKAGFKTYQCVLCAFVYDEAEGYPHAGIAPGTRWADVPESFDCPDCAATKADFEMIEF